MSTASPNARRIGFLIVACTLPFIGIGAAPADEAALGREILNASGVRGGLIVHLSCGDGKLTAALGTEAGCLVHGLDADAENVAKARASVQTAGAAGLVSVAQWRGNHLPYVDNLVNLVVCDGPLPVAMDEVQRVLAPGGAVRVREEGKWTRTVKPRPAAMDEWTHYLHDAGNNAVSRDDLVGPPRRMQWIGRPRWSRHHDHMASMSAMVTTNGRLFYIFDEGPTSSILLPSRWRLIARDAFNGSVLWKRKIDRWHTRLWPLKSGPAQLPRRLVAVGDRVFATLSLDAPATVLDAATGKTIKTLEGTRATEEILHCDGVLLLLIRDGDARAPGFVPGRRRGRGNRLWPWGKRRIMAVNAESGETLWSKTYPVMPGTLAADGKRVCFHDGEKVVCLNRTDGKQLWTSEAVPRTEKMYSWFAPTLVLYKDVVLFAGGEKLIPHRAGKDTMTALAAETGKVLWKAPHPQSGYQSAEDLLVSGGLVWTGATVNGSVDGVFTGRDPTTGEVRSTFAPNVKTYWFHHRCYRGKATDKYLLMSRTGIEFLDTAAKSWEIHHWVRGGCLYGIMPANGLIYAPMHDCACYPEAKQFGMNALAAKGAVSEPVEVADEKRLIRGPAYAGCVEGAAAAPDWPAFRHDDARSGRATTAVRAELASEWQIALGGRLSAPVVADGKLFVAQIDKHTVHARDAGSGRSVWRYTAGGRVDSPPTFVDGRLFFGSADGWATCLRASDGAVIWRFLAAPADRRLVAFEQVESVWPVHGSLLVRDGVVFVLAGRSMFLDGGLRLYRLDAKTGAILSKSVMDDRIPQTDKSLQSRVKVLNMPVALPDVLSSDGKYVYMRSQVFDLAGNREALGPHSPNPLRQGAVQRGETAHLFSPTGLLDGSWFHRAYWVYGRSFAGGHAGYHAAGKFAPSGRILTFDERCVYGFGRKPRYLRWTTTMEYHLFAADRPGAAKPPAPPTPAPAAAAPAAPASKGRGSVIRVGNAASLNPAGKPLAVEAWVKAAKPTGVIVARGGPAQGWALLVKDGKPRFAIRSDDAISQVTAERVIGKDWTHLAGVLTAEKKLQVYVDGKLAAEAAGTAFIASEPKQPMEIGADDRGPVGDYTSPLAFAGAIDEVRVYFGTVTAEEIAAHAAVGGKAAAAKARLVACYSFDEGNAADLSGGGNHGTVEGATCVDGKFSKAMAFVGRLRMGSIGRKRTPASRVKHNWTRSLPMLVRAMALAGKTLFVAGPPDLVDEEKAKSRYRDPRMRKKLAEQAAALDGKKGALLWAVSTADGEKISELKLAAPPAWDAMAAAGGKLYLCTTDGKITCFGGK